MDNPIRPVGAERVWVHQGEAQGTTYTVKYVSQDSVSQTAFEACLEEVDVEMNAWRPSSTLSQFNGTHLWMRHSVLPTPLGCGRMSGAFRQTFTDWSGGAFDVTVGPLMKLWGFRMERRDVVTPSMVDSVRSFARFAGDVVQFVPKASHSDTLVPHCCKSDARDRT